MNKTVDGIQVEKPYEINGKMRALIVLSVLGVMGFLIYRNALSFLIVRVLQKHDSSHGLFVPFISGYLVWLKFEKIREARFEFALIPGTVMAGVGLLLYFLVGDRSEVAVPVFSFLLVAGGLLLGLFGKDVFKQLYIPLFFFATMIPVPKPIYSQVADWMRMVSTSGAVWVVQLFNFPIYREGFNVSIPNMDLFVDVNCSGIRFLIPYFVFGLTYAYVCKKTITSRVLVVLATIPISLISAVLRQFIVFLLAYYIPFTVEHLPHLLISWFVFITVLVVAIWMDRWLSKSVSRIDERRPGEINARESVVKGKA